MTVLFQLDYRHISVSVTNKWGFIWLKGILTLQNDHFCIKSLMWLYLKFMTLNILIFLFIFFDWLGTMFNNIYIKISIYELSQNSCSVIRVSFIQLYAQYFPNTCIFVCKHFDLKPKVKLIYAPFKARLRFFSKNVCVWKHWACDWISEIWIALHGLCESFCKPKLWHIFEWRHVRKLTFLHKFKVTRCDLLISKWSFCGWSIR